MILKFFMNILLGVENQPGIIPQAVDDVFYYIKEMVYFIFCYVIISNFI